MLYLNCREVPELLPSTLIREVFYERNMERNKKVSENQSKYKIIQKDKQNNIIRIWDNMWEITHNTNFKKSNIQKCCQKKQNAAYNFKWEYSTL